MSRGNPNIREDSINGAAAERSFKEWATAQGWNVSRGWPDYLVIDDQDQVFTVEVKQSRYAQLSPAQQRVSRILERLGIKCMRWSPDEGMMRWNMATLPMDPPRIPAWRKALANRVVEESERVRRINDVRERYGI